MSLLTEPLTSRSLPSVEAARRLVGNDIGRAVNPILCGAFYLFIISLPFEMPRRSIPLEVPTITASIFLLTTLLEPRLCFWRIPQPLCWFVAYLATFGVALTLNGAEWLTRVKELFLLLFQAMLIFWAASNLMRNEQVARAALWSLVVACLVRAALPLLGFGKTAQQVWTGGERLTAFGQNANHSALLLGGGLLALIGLTYGHHRGVLRPRFLVWPLFALLAFAIVQTGSRGGLITLGAGLLVFALAAKTASLRFRNGFIVVLATAGLTWEISRSEVMRNRLMPTEGIQMLAGRERIFPALWDMFQEKPLAGWGPVNNQYEVALRIGERSRPSRDAHNLILELLTSTGILGAGSFLIGLSMCMTAAMKGRHGIYGPLPAALLAALLAANMSGNFITVKFFWLVLAFALASASQVVGTDTRATVARLTAAPARVRAAIET